MNPVPAVSEVEPACVPTGPDLLLTIFAIAQLTRAIYPENLNIRDHKHLPPDLIRGSLTLCSPIDESGSACAAFSQKKWRFWQSGAAFC